MGIHYVKTPTIFQMEATECGAASLSMIFAYYGHHIPLEKMRIETGVSRDGCSAGNLMRAAKKHGFECKGFRKEIKDLVKLKPPCIIHWNFNHFVVFEGTKFGHAYINDPAVGRRKLTMEELDDGFTGVVLTFNKTSNVKRQRKQRKSKDYVTKRLQGKYGVIFKLFYVGVLLVFPGILLPVLSQAFIDDILSGGNTLWFTQFMIFMAAAIVLKAGLSYYRGFLLQKVQNKITLVSSYDFLLHLFKLPLEFFDQRYTGDLVNRADNNENVNSFLAGDLAETILNIIIAGFYLIILFIYSTSLTFVGLGCIVINLLIVKIFSGTIARMSMKLQQDSGKLYGVICSGLSITSTLKASGAENEYLGRILGFHAKTIDVEQRLSKLQEIINAITGAIDKISDVAILTLGAIFVVRGEFTVGMLVAFTSFFDSFNEPIADLIKFIKKIQSLKADVSRVTDIENYDVDINYTKEIKGRIETRKIQGDVQFYNVSFGYSKLKEPLINRFSFNILSGQTIAFVGYSGCGKSTISKLASGLYEPWNGEVLYDGKKLKDISREVINASISAVNQNITLFSGSIRDNITMWNDSILEKDVVNAAKDACIHDVILKKPGGYDFVLTENGDNLSGGQRQRLEIARALVTNPTVLIMDEATSALDPIVEKKIMDNIKRRGCTCLIVAHRLSAIRDCDMIIVMKNGQVVQQGNHDELSAQEGYYKQFIRNI